MYSLKFELQINKKGKIVNISDEYEGRQYAFLQGSLKIQRPRDVEKIVDFGYKGLQKRTENVLILYKKSKKTSLK